MMTHTHTSLKFGATLWISKNHLKDEGCVPKGKTNCLTHFKLEKLSLPEELYHIFIGVLILFFLITNKNLFDIFFQIFFFFLIKL